MALFHLVGPSLCSNVIFPPILDGHVTLVTIFPPTGFDFNKTTVNILGFWCTQKTRDTYLVNLDTRIECAAALNSLEIGLKPECYMVHCI